MKFRNDIALMMAVIIVMTGIVLAMQPATGQDKVEEKDVQSSLPYGDSYLVSLWTSGDPEVAEKVCFMYTHNAKKLGWFDNVNLIVWGPSSQLLAGNTSLQSQVQSMMNDGVVVQACKACADMYGVTQILQNLGIEVKYMGLPLSNMLKENRKVLTF